MSIICPTVLAVEPHEYREQFERVKDFAKRVQIDLKDGVFAPGYSVGLENVWWPDHIQVDLHLMYQKPDDYIEKIVALKPDMVIVHAEADGDFPRFADQMSQAGITTGIALLPKTSPESIRSFKDLIKHVLIFSGKLGEFGGTADLMMCEKVRAIRDIDSSLEIGWDGGINVHNILQIHNCGVDVLNVGGAIQNASDPKDAYATLVSSLEGKR
jgi:ribulose-phosphate 3-epimerase